MATNTGLSVAQAMILAALKPQGFAQVTADIVRIKNQSFGQSLAAMVKFAKQVGLGQTQGDIKVTYSGSAQTQAFITI